MEDELTTYISIRNADRFMWIGIAVAVVFLAVLLSAPFVPIDSDVKLSEQRSISGIKPLTRDPQEMGGLLQQISGRHLIRPAQIQAAVKNTGVAAQLVKRLKLLGIARMKDNLVAYIQVDTGRVATVRKGETILDFIVEDIQSGKVALSLDGVNVVLVH